MNFAKDMSEHPGVQILTVLGLVSGATLDGLNKQEYFLWIAGMTGILLLIIAYLVSRERKVYDTEILPIPIVINIDSNEATSYVLKNLFTQLEQDSKFKNLRNNLKRYRSIVENDLMFTYSGDLYDKERMISFMQLIKYQITKIKESVPNKVEFHLAYYKRPAYGIFLGYVFAEEDLVIYQNNPNEDLFNKVAEIKGRKHKNTINRYQKFDVKRISTDKNSDTLLIGIKAASHNINFNTPNLQKYTNIISFEAKHEGTIKLEEDWVQYVREIFTLLNEEQTKYKHITIAHAMPEAIAVMIGLAIGNYWSVMITQYEFGEGDYFDIFPTNHLKCYF